MSRRPSGSGERTAPEGFLLQARIRGRSALAGSRDIGPPGPGRPPGRAAGSGGGGPSAGVASRRSGVAGNRPVSRDIGAVSREIRRFPETPERCHGTSADFPRHPSSVSGNPPMSRDIGAVSREMRRFPGTSERCLRKSADFPGPSSAPPGNPPKPGARGLPYPSSAANTAWNARWSGSSGVSTACGPAARSKPSKRRNSVAWRWAS